MSYAQGTVVSPEKSRAEIEGLLRKYGADQFVSGWGDNRAVIGFRASGRFVRFTLDDRMRSGGAATMERRHRALKKLWYFEVDPHSLPSQGSLFAAALTLRLNVKSTARPEYPPPYQQTPGGSLEGTPH